MENITGMDMALFSSLLITASVFIYYMLFNLLFSIIGSWKMFTKAGEAGWKAIIPYYSQFIHFSLFWKKDYFWAFLVTTVVSALASIFSGLVATLASLAIAVLLVMLNVKTAHHFGKGGGMAFLLTVCPGLGQMILGFGKAQYIENIQ